MSILEIEHISKEYRHGVRANDDFALQISPLVVPALLLAGLHRILPVKHAADVVRGTLARGYSDGLELGFMVLGVWFVVAFGITYAVVRRRR